MRKINFLPVCLLALCFTVLASFKTGGSSKIDDYEFDSNDLVYDRRSGDFAEGSIPGIDTKTALPVEISICPGTGERCTVWIWDGNNPTIYLGKKTPGGPDVVVSF